MSIEAVVRVIYSPPPRGSRHVGALEAYRVLLAIAEDADEDGRGNFPSRSQQTIAEELNMERRTVRDALSALVEQGRVRLITEGIPRRSGAVYDLSWISGDHPATRAGIPHQLGQGFPIEQTRDSGRDSTPTRAGNSGRQLGQATRAGIPCHNPNPDPENPPTPLSAFDEADTESLELTIDDVETIGNERVRAVLARRLIEKHAGNGDTELAFEVARRLFPPEPEPEPEPKVRLTGLKKRARPMMVDTPPV